MLHRIATFEGSLTLLKASLLKRPLRIEHFNSTGIIISNLFEQDRDFQEVLALNQTENICTVSGEN